MRKAILGLASHSQAEQGKWCIELCKRRNYGITAGIVAKPIDDVNAWFINSIFE